jgi:Putative adhesin
VKALPAWIGTAAIISFSLATPAFAAERTHDTDLREAMEPGTTLAIRGIRGSIVATAGDGNVAAIHAHASSRDGDPSEIRVHATRAGNVVIVCALYPGMTDCEDRNSRHSDPFTSDVTVDFTVSVPDGVKLRAEAVEGNVVATRLVSDVSASTVHGDVRIATAGQAEARTVDGGIEATIGATPSAGDLSFETVNGPIHLTLPHDANASISARTLSGPIDAPGLSVDDNEYVGHSAAGRYGHGGPHITLRSVNGPINVSES